MSETSAFDPVLKPVRAALDHIQAGRLTEADREVLLSAYRAGQLSIGSREGAVIASGKGAVTVGKDVHDSIIVTGHGNRVVIERPLTDDLLKRLRDIGLALLALDDVSDLHANPYLGLASYTYETRAFYGGREQPIREAVGRLTAPGDEPVLLFVTGASGSGKSSFAQAGLLPALEDAYAPQGRTVRWSVLRPGRHPIEALGRALRALGLTEPPDGDWSSLLRTPDNLNHLLTTQTPREQVNVLVFDQFEELFTQADPAERDVTCVLLRELGSFKQLRTQVIATLRADYLSALFDAPVLWERSQHDSIALRAMASGELARAIRQPLQAQAKLEGKDKRIDPALVERLVEDVGDDPTLLPLLQVTLRSLWDKPPQRLVLGRYTSLAASLEQQANQVVEQDARGRERPASEREQLMGIFLDLVEVSLDDDPRRDVRRALPKQDVLQGHPERTRLIEELVNARLVTTWVEPPEPTGVEMIDIIHESLLSNWPRLSQEIAARREALQQRERFRLALREWLQEGRSQAYLLQGVRLAEARSLAERNDVALRDPDGRAFLQASTEAEAEVRTRELRQARRRQRILGGVAGVAMLFAIAAVVAAVIAFNSQQVAEQQTVLAEERTTLAQEQTALAQNEASARATAEAIAQDRAAAAELAQASAESAKTIANSREIAATALGRLTVDPQLGLLLAIEAAHTAPTAQAEDALRQAVQASHLRFVLGGHARGVRAAFSPDAQFVLTSDDGKVPRVWDATTGNLVAPLNGHTDPITLAMFSPGGESVLTASRDHTVREWQTRTGASLGDARAPDRSGDILAISPDGELVVSAAPDTSAQVWDRRTGRALQVLGPHRGDVRLAAFSPDSKVVFTAASPGEPSYLWDARTGARVSEIHGHSGLIESAAFSPDSQLLVTGSLDDTVRLWATGSGDQLHQLRGWRAEFSPDGKRVVTASRDWKASVWDTASGGEVLPLHGHTNAVYSASFSRDGRYVLTASGDTTARVWDTQTGSSVVELRGHPGTLTRAEFSPDSRYVLTGDPDDGTARIWQTGLPQELSQAGRVSTDALSLDGQVLVTTGRDGAPRIWDVGTRKNIAELASPLDPRSSASVSPDGARVAVAYTEGLVRLWDTRSGGVGAVLRGHPPSNLVEGAVFSPDSQRILDFSTDGTARLWDARSGSPAGELRGHTGWVADARFSPDGKYVATGGYDDRKVLVWDANTGAVVADLRGHSAGIRSVAFSPDGKHVVSAADRTARIWDVSSGASLFVLEGHTSGVTSARFSPDGRYVVTASGDTTARVWDAQTGSAVAELRGHTSDVSSATFSPDGQFVLTASWDGTGRVWEWRSGKTVMELRGASNWLTNAIFGPDGQQIVTGSTDGSARIYTCEVCRPLDVVLSLAQARVVRPPLSAAERTQYLP